MIDISKIDFNKGNGLVPVVAQDVDTRQILMLGYANEEAMKITIETNKLTFYSRSKNRLWTKGEQSGNFLLVQSMALDCDQDTVLALVHPHGPVCHTGDDTCWGQKNESSNLSFLQSLEATIVLRKSKGDAQRSYVADLFAKGINKIAQKVGEEAVELVIEAKDDNKDLFLGEAADLLFHYLILLQAKDCKLEDVVGVLKGRHKE